MNLAGTYNLLPFDASISEGGVQPRQWKEAGLIEKFLRAVVGPVKRERNEDEVELAATLVIPPPKRPRTMEALKTQTMNATTALATTHVRRCWHLGTGGRRK